MTVWAAVVAALGASLITGGLTWGTSWYQERRRDKQSALQDKAAAYHDLAARSLSFASRAQTLRTAIEIRSGLGEALDLARRTRSPVDPFELYDWLAKDSDPLCTAWSRIGLIGTQDACDAATKLLDACADFQSAATMPGKRRGQVATTFLGQSWTAEQVTELKERLRDVVARRETFMKVARHELGQADVVFPAEQRAITSPDESVGATHPTATSNDDASITDGP